MRWAWRYIDLQNNLGFSLCAVPSVYYMVTTLNKRKMSGIELSTDWYVTIEHWRLSSIEVIFVNYQTSELQHNYQSYIQGIIQKMLRVSVVWPLLLQVEVSVKIVRSGLSCLLFSLSIFILFLIYFHIFYFQNLGLGLIGHKS